MKPGDLVIPLQPCNIHAIKDSTFFRRGATRRWEPSHPALIVSEYNRVVGGNNILKYQILLDGEYWWIGAGSVQLLDVKHETR